MEFAPISFPSCLKDLTKHVLPSVKHVMFNWLHHLLTVRIHLSAWQLKITDSPDEGITLEKMPPYWQLRWDLYPHHKENLKYSPRACLHWCQRTLSPHTWSYTALHSWFQNKNFKVSFLPLPDIHSWVQPSISPWDYGENGTAGSLGGRGRLNCGSILSVIVQFLILF